ncbi:MAG: electron transport complex subunit RsxA [Gammaproteobacteria bacterium]|nr:electron transport complex subunit RsxA [Gammaproteobacteria bacterium]
MSEIFLVFFAACLANNLVLDYLLGLGPTLAVSRSIEAARELSLCLLVLVPLTTLSTHLLNEFVLIPFKLEYIQTLAFIVCITFEILLLENLLRKKLPILHQRIAVFFPLLLVNTSLLGIALIDTLVNEGLLVCIYYSLGAALGFALLVIPLSALRERIEYADVPFPFRGPSILLMTLGIISMAFSGFSGFS